MHLRSVLTLALLVACSGEDIGPTGLQPVLPLEDPSGPGVEGAPSLDLADQQAVWLATEHLVPGFEWGSPSIQIPDEIWTLVTGPAIADEGSCPYRILEGFTTTWRSECRSNEGYEWRGSLSEEDAPADDGSDVVRRTYDIEVWATTDDRDFDRAEIRGTVIDIQPDGGDLLQHLEVDIRVSLEGWWSLRNDPDHEEVWADLRWKGWAEAFAHGEDIRWAIDMDVQVGPHGVMRFGSESLVRGSRCDDEPDGTAEVLASASTEFGFEGSRTCDRCVEYTAGGESFKACP